MCVWQCPGTGTQLAQSVCGGQRKTLGCWLSLAPPQHHQALALFPLSCFDRSIMILNVSSYFCSPTSYSFPHFQSFWKHSQTQSEACLTAAWTLLHPTRSTRFSITRALQVQGQRTTGSFLEEAGDPGPHACTRSALTLSVSALVPGCVCSRLPKILGEIFPGISFKLRHHFGENRNL